MTGTAAEITAVRSVDRKKVGTGTPGPVTRLLRDAFFGLFDGRTQDRYGWLTHVNAFIRERDDENPVIHNPSSHQKHATSEASA
jgi:branched-chain amino acid aminotransferase